MNLSYIIHKIPKDNVFFIALSLKNAMGVLACDKRSQLGIQDKKIAEAVIKDFNASKPLKVTPLEYGKFEKVPLSDAQTSFFLTELAKVKEVYFENKRVIIDALSMAKLVYEVCLENDLVKIKGYIVDGSSRLELDEIEAFIGQKTVWVLHKGVLKKLKQEAKWLKLAQDQAILEGKKKEQFLDQYENELPLASSIPEAKFIHQKTQKIAPEPLLILKNERGLFFDLKFTYDKKTFVSFLDYLNPLFNKEEELFWENILVSSGVKKSGKEYFVSSPDQERIFKSLSDQGFKILTSDHKQLRFLKTTQAVISDEGDDLKLELALHFDDRCAQIDPLLKAVIKKNPIVELDDKSVGFVPLKLLDELEVLAFGKKQGQGMLFKKEMKGDITFSLVNTEDKTKIDLDQVQFDFFNLKLLPFQKKGVAWLLSHMHRGFSCLLADDMGLGKTIQVLALIDLMKHALKKGVLIVCPKSIKPQWEESLAQYLKGIPLEISVHSFHEIRAAKDIKEVSLTIIDEAQGIKNPKTQLFQKCCQIKTDLKIALTGTPIENSLQDVISLFNFLSQNLIADLDKQSSLMNAAKIKRRLAPFMLRRMKKEVLSDLPELFEQDCFVDMDESQALVYQNLIQEAKEHPTHIFSLITKLRQAALDPRLIDPTIKDMSPKTWQVLEDIHQIIASDQKVIVFSQFTSYLAFITQHLNELGLAYSYLDGQTQNREKVIEEFAQDTNILVMSLKAGGVGLNLQMADYVLLLDPWWNEAVENQAIARAYRLGRQKPVVAKRYLTQGTLETKIQALKSQKLALLDGLGDLSHVPANELLELILS